MPTHPIVEKMLLNNNSSFVAKTFTTPEYELGWHHHPEYELVLITNCEGLAFIGNYIGEYETGDIYFIGSNLPHTFPKKQPGQIASSIVVQFKEDFWGSGFLGLPECKKLNDFLKKSSFGMKILGEGKEKLAQLIKALENAEGLQRIILNLGW
ncbi:hypothetical protein [Parasediminibacterium sp. JCM 36343]|uniref:hypothetical protein n=1 Tax=Parasediminibacterium sp. JCM 36343 TaxID=3374279 RepID=UPI00397A5510